MKYIERGEIMKMMKIKKNNSQDLKTIFGLLFAGIVYFYAVLYIYIFNSNKGSVFESDVKVINFAHWHTEDGVKEGFDAAIKLYEEMKAKQGIKVKVIQSIIPSRGYRQWYLTQLVGGNPVDIIQLAGSPNIQYQYMRHLSAYIGKVNPYNKGTVLEGMPWKDTILDGMKSMLDKNYSEYFGIKVFVHYDRIFVNLDLLKQITGKDKAPTTISDWFDSCKTIKDYAKKEHKIIIPIVGRGISRKMLWFFHRNYFSQMNGILNDLYGRYYDADVRPADILKAYREGKVEKNRLYGFVDIMSEMGNYFAEGFNAMDSEQAAYLFYTKKAVFYLDGTWDISPIFKNADFNVAVIRIPVIDKNYRYYKYFTGDIAEADTDKGSKFGIPKASKNFDLALDFLKFLTSYKINLLISSYCKFAPVVKKAEYKGLLKYAKPNLKGNPLIPTPFFSGIWKSASMARMLESLETIIIEKKKNPIEYFNNSFKNYRKFIYSELQEGLKNINRNTFKYEMQRSQIFIGNLRKKITQEEKLSLTLRKKMLLEAFEKHALQYFYTKDFIKELKKVK